MTKFLGSRSEISGTEFSTERCSTNGWVGKFFGFRSKINLGQVRWENLNLFFKSSALHGFWENPLGQFEIFGEIFGKYFLELF